MDKFSQTWHEYQLNPLNNHHKKNRAKTTPGPFGFISYPIVCTQPHEFLYSVPDTFEHHTSHMKTLVVHSDLLHPFDPILLQLRMEFFLLHHKVGIHM